MCAVRLRPSSMYWYYIVCWLYKYDYNSQIARLTFITSRRVRPRVASTMPSGGDVIERLLSTTITISLGPVLAATYQGVWRGSAKEQYFALLVLGS